MIRCDYCEEGNVAVDGWHTYPDMDPDEYALMDLSFYRVPCASDPPLSDGYAAETVAVIGDIL